MVKCSRRKRSQIRIIQNKIAKDLSKSYVVIGIGDLDLKHFNSKGEIDGVNIHPNRIKGRYKPPVYLARSVKLLEGYVS